MNTERLFFLDNVKAIGILLLIVGHLTSGSVIQSIIYSFHMPLFVVVSGYLISYKREYEKTFWEYTKGKLKSLIVPYLYFSVILFLIGFGYFIFGKYCWYMESYINMITNTILGYGIGTLWFLPFLFLLEEGIWLFKNKQFLGKIVMICIVLFSLIGMTALKYYDISYSNSLTTRALTVLLRSGIAFPFMIIGKTLQYEDNKQKDKTMVIFSIISFVIWVICLAINNDMVDLYSLNIKNIFTYYLKAITGSIFVIEICRIKVNKRNIISDTLGRKSLLYMVINNLPCITILSTLVSSIIGFNSWILQTISVIIVSSFFVVVIDIFVKKIRFRVRK